MDNLFFYASKIIWFVISPDHALILFLLLGLFLLYTRYALLGRRLLVGVSVALCLLTCLPVGQYLLYPLESRFQTNPKLPEHIDGIVVLSGAEVQETSFLSGRPQLNDAGDRITGLLELLHRYPNARAVFTGDSGLLNSNWPGGADIAEKLLADVGVSAGRVAFERASRNTYENAKFTQLLVRPTPGEQWVLVTSAYHMPRSVGIFKKLGWDVIPFPVDHAGLPMHAFRIQVGFSNNLSNLKTACKEWIGLVAYRLTGKTESLLP